MPETIIQIIHSLGNIYIEVKFLLEDENNCYTDIVISWKSVPVEHECRS
jgi:hypothetical protein